MYCIGCLEWIPFKAWLLQLDHKSEIQLLSAHREEVNEALLNHKDVLEKVQYNFGEVDTGLKEHRQHITKLARKSGDVDERLEEIASDVETLQRQLSSSMLSKTTLAPKDLMRLQQQIDKFHL